MFLRGIALASIALGISIGAHTLGCGRGTSSTSERSVTLSWERPTTYTDGAPMTDLVGYNIRYGASPGVYTTTVAVNDPNALSVALNDLAPGQTYYFVITALSASAGESAPSNEASKAIP